MSNIFANLTNLFDIFYNTLNNIQFFGISLISILVGMSVTALFVSLLDRLTK